MKNLIYLFFISLFSHQFCIAQDIPEPEFNARPYYLENGELKNMERANATIDLKLKGLGYGGSESFYTVFGYTSPKRFTIDELPRIFIQFNDNVDPEELILIVKNEIMKKKKKKDRRRFKQGSRKMFGKARDVSGNQISFSVKKVRDGIYEIIFDNGLEPGEYAFIPFSGESVSLFGGGPSNVRLTCFGVD